ncbi:hypothetical protein DVK02_14850 [Halobellus sp. Atlit-31R]|nr:hypothetical protein DVK02_14850 [Halobellus sp. Atlit-31R]
MFSRSVTDGFEIQIDDAAALEALGIGHYHVVCHDCEVETMCNERSAAQALVDRHRLSSEHNIEFQELRQ